MTQIKEYSCIFYLIRFFAEILLFNLPARTCGSNLEPCLDRACFTIKSLHVSLRNYFDGS